MLAVDFGDAPDAAVGTSRGNYRSLLADDGPRHVIVAGLHLGATVDADNGLLQNLGANADDVDAALPDDEQGLVDPTTDLRLTVGAAPRIRVRATNTSANVAHLYGWIDYNQDGEFDNVAERAYTVVPAGTVDGTFTLAFPTVPFDAPTGTTYASFRLSTDVAAAHATGAAADGEVEDYRASVAKTSKGTADPQKSKKIASDLGMGVQAHFRGPRLFDAPETKELVARWTDWYKQHRDVLESDIVHGRRADGRDVDWILHVNPQGDPKGMVVAYNPLLQPARRTIRVDAYYTGLTGTVKVSHAGQAAYEGALAADRSLDLEIDVPPRGMTWYTLR